MVGGNCWLEVYVAELTVLFVRPLLKAMALMVVVLLTVIGPVKSVPAVLPAFRAGPHPVTVDTDAKHSLSGKPVGLGEVLPTEARHIEDERFCGKRSDDQDRRQPCAVHKAL